MVLRRFDPTPGQPRRHQVSRVQAEDRPEQEREGFGVPYSRVAIGDVQGATDGGLKAFGGVIPAARSRRSVLLEPTAAEVAKQELTPWKNSSPG